jgi:hypothetical protein
MDESQVRERLVLQRDRARDERDEYLSIIRKLLALEDGPRSAHFDRAWTRAMETAREVVGSR